jgi:hypothetical protein
MTYNQLDSFVPAPHVSASDAEVVARWFQSEDACRQLAQAAAYARDVIEQFNKASVIPPEELYRPITLA